MGDPANGSYDLVIIGAGPGGYTAANRAGQLGLRTAVVEKDPTLGGTCLNVGCIPSKALLHSSELLEEARDGFAEQGIKVSGVELDLPAMMKRKAKVVTTLTRGIAGLFKKNKVDWVSGTGRIAGAGRVAVTAADGTTRELATKAILIAAGSVPIELPGLAFDGKRIIDSTGALELDAVPGELIVVGAGAIGLELGSVWRRLGSKVTVVELTPGTVPGMDREMAKLLERALQKQGMKFLFETKVESAKVAGERVQLTVRGKDDKTGTLEADVLLVAVGRRAYPDLLGLKDAGIKTAARGRIEVDHHFATSVPGIYAVGDVIAGPMLAHKAEDEGVACVEQLAGKAGHVNYDAIPAVVYTFPELASVGITEEQAKAQGTAVRIGRFPMIANARAKTMGQVEGSVKMIADAKTDRILGVHIFATHAGDLIAEAAVAIEMGASSEDVARSTHAHPTLPEAIKEAALAVDGRSLNS
jgi:dihydrolipoamide dehydrogenase